MAEIDQSAYDVSRPCTEYSEMQVDWKLPETLWGGTKKMRDAGVDYLPLEPEEDSLKYRCRLQRTILFNAFKETIRRLVSKPFSEPVTIKGKLPAELQPIIENADRGGHNLTQYAKKVMTDALIYGKSHTYVDHPPTEEQRSRSEDIAQGIYPYFSQIKAPDLIGWRSTEEELQQTRWKYSRVEPKGLYGDERVDYIKVTTPEVWALYSKRENEKWSPVVDKGGHMKNHSGKPLGAIPLVPYYTNQTGFMKAYPPLMGLAEQNLLHWQAKSDFINYMRFAMIGAVWGTGVDKATADSFKGYSVNSKFFTSNDKAAFGILEHQGKAAKIGKEYVRSIEERMEILGMQPLLQRLSNVTATGQYIDEAKIHCDIQAWIRALEAHFIECFKYAALWRGVKIPKDFKVVIYDEFILPSNVIKDLELLLKATIAGKLSTATFLAEAKRRGLLMEDFDPEEEVRKIKQDDPTKFSDDDDLDDGDFEVKDGKGKKKEKAGGFQESKDKSELVGAAT